MIILEHTLTAGNKCYQLSSDKKTWSDAQVSNASSYTHTQQSVYAILLFHICLMLYCVLKTYRLGFIFPGLHFSA